MMFFHEHHKFHKCCPPISPTNRPIEIPCHPRVKIDSIISRSTPHPDPDAPEDPESVRFWCRTGATHHERERTSVTGTSHAAIATTGETLAAMTSELQENGTTGPCLSRPALRSLVDVATQPVDPPAAPAAPAAAKSKAKAKAKGKVQVQASKEPAEKRTAIRFLFQLVRFFEA